MIIYCNINNSAHLYYSEIGRELKRHSIDSYASKGRQTWQLGETKQVPSACASQEASRSIALPCEDIYDLVVAAKWISYSFYITAILHIFQAIHIHTR